MNLDNFLRTLQEVGTNAGLKILLALVILFVGIKLSKWLIKLLQKGKAFNKIEKGARSFITSFIRIALYALVIATAAMCCGVPSTAFLTIFTSAGVAIGLALQGGLSNFAGGLMILFFRPFKVGDFIESDGASGTITEITVIYTIVTTPDNRVITIPNGKLTNANITNYSSKKQRRVEIIVSASYDSDTEFVKQTLLEVAAGTKGVLDDPAPVARLKEMSASSIDFVYRVWCKTPDYWDVYFDSMERIKKTFDEKGIEIPYKKVDVNIIKE